MTEIKWQDEPPGDIVAACEYLHRVLSPDERRYLADMIDDCDHPRDARPHLARMLVEARGPDPREAYALRNALALASDRDRRRAIDTASGAAYGRPDVRLPEPLAEDLAAVAHAWHTTPDALAARIIGAWLDQYRDGPGPWRSDELSDRRNRPRRDFPKPSPS